MRKSVFLFLLLYLANAAYANPIILPDSMGGLGYIAVLLSSIAVEVSIVTLILLFFDMSPKPVWIVLFIGNMVVYFIIFVPFYDAAKNLLLAEILIVALDGILIKIISFCDTFQLETFTRLKWMYAFIIAAVGNMVSYYIGTIISD